MMNINVITGTRLHFGLLCGAPDSDWHYGGVGMMVQSPSWNIELRQNMASDSDEILADQPVHDRISKLLTAYRSKNNRVPFVRCNVRNQAGLHTGLGAGTQLTLAIATGLRLLDGQPRPADISTVASELGRSRRSAVGTYGFDHGGFIVDRGRNTSPDTPACQRFRFPNSWRMVLLTPSQCVGLSGTKEESFFGTRQYLDPGVLNEIVNLVTNDISPALTNEDFSGFTLALSRYGDLVGGYYADQQGGTFSSQLVRQLAPWMADQQLRAVQSSWGPTVCIPGESEEHAQSIKGLLETQVSDDEAMIEITRGLNTGATVTSAAPEDYRSFG